MFTQVPRAKKGSRLAMSARGIYTYYTVYTSIRDDLGPDQSWELCCHLACGDDCDPVRG